MFVLGTVGHSEERMLLIHGRVPLIVAFCTSFCGGSSHRVEVWVFLVSPQFKLGFVPEAGSSVEWLLVFVLDAVDVVQETDPPGHCECAEGSFRGKFQTLRSSRRCGREDSFSTAHISTNSGESGETCSQGGN